MPLQNKNLLIAFAAVVILAALIGFNYFDYWKAPSQQNESGLELIEEGFNSPVYLTEADDKLYVVDRIGIIKKIGEEEYFLDIRDRMVDLRSNFDERGLLGLAFHPNFEINKKFFVYYSSPLRPEGPEGWDHTARISEFVIGEDGMAKPESEKIILEVDEPQFNHDGGHLLFGKDGYLYISLGDGGNANDVGLGHTKDIGNAQDTNNLLGSILRIDVDSGNNSNYKIPSDNPFVGTDKRGEIYAYGLRNVFRMSLDEETGRLFAGDVGQNLWEEINIIEKGKNYGWNIKEGSQCFDPDNPDESPEICRDSGYSGEELVDPIIEYKNAETEEGVGLSVIGGYVYRGSKIPWMKGKYVFGDWSSSFSKGKGIIFVAEENEESKEWDIVNQTDINSFIMGFGEDSEGEIYLLTNDNTGPVGNTGKVYKINENLKLN